MSDPSVTSASSRVLFLIARAGFTAFFVLTSSYCLLAYIPFTYQWVIKCTLVKWLPVFVKLHPAFYWAAILLATFTLTADLRKPRTRNISIGFIVLHVAAGAILIFHPLLPGLVNDNRSYYWSLTSLVPLLWVAAIDFVGNMPEKHLQWRRLDNLTITMAVVAGVFLSSLYASLSCARLSSAGNQLRTSEYVIVLTWSIVAHIVVFILAFVVLKSIKRIAERFATPSKFEFYSYVGLTVLLLTLLVRQMILGALTFHTPLADGFSAAVAFTVVASISGLTLRLQTWAWADSINRSESISLRTSHPWAFRIVGLGLIAVSAFTIPAAVATRDWDFLIQKLGVVAIWIITIVFFLTIQGRHKRAKYTYAGLLLTVAVTVGWYTVLGSSEALWPAMLGDERLDVDATLDRYSNYDVSFKLARDILRPNLILFPSTRANPTEAESVNHDESFYGFLQQNTNLLPSVKVTPVDIKLAGELTRTGSQKPNMFIFVIDSLRQDYVSPYNKSVSFTPNFDSFARESLVMRNAFTRYGGTVLAEPSIWTGALQLHKQYIEPYYPMNSLEKLIEIEGYQNFITIDPVLRVITKPSLDAIELDKEYEWFEYDLCRTLKELQIKIDERQDSARPMFVYTEPQNVHRMVLKDKVDTVPTGEQYPGFFAPYASQVQYMDACFGEFIRYLKSRGLYDNSIVILTSDHGDSLGEDGRWGHSYWMFPEILRVPLMVHLPPAMLKGMACNTSLLSFTTDITPTLYYLLGHMPIEHNAMFGRPLVTSTEKEQTDYLQPFYLLVSSYGPVYGVLGSGGRSLFIADAVNQKEYFFNLVDDPKGARNGLTRAIQADNERLIRDLVERVNQFYGLGEYP